MESLGTVPDRPLPCWGWGDIPDQYGRRWNGDDGSTPMPPAPDGTGDLPPILPWWGPKPSRARQATPPSGESPRSATATSSRNTHVDSARQPADQRHGYGHRIGR